MNTATRCLTRIVVALTIVALGVSGCTGSASPPTASTRGTGTPTTSVDLVGNPDEKSPTWSVDLDPASVYGLHKRRGLATVVRPETKVLTAAETATITGVRLLNKDVCLSRADQHPVCEFEIGFTQLPAGIAVGSVLNSGITPTTPDGLLVKVTAIDGSTVRAVQAGLPDALEQGEFWVERAFTPDQLRGEPKLAPGVKFVTRVGPSATKGTHAVPSFDVSLPGELSLDVEPVSGVQLSGSLDFGVGCGLNGGVGTDIAWMETGCRAWQKAALQINAAATGPGGATDYFVADIPLAGFVIPIGPIIVVVIVDILITVDLGGTVHAGLHYGASETTEVYAGLRFSIADGLDHDGGVSARATASSCALSAPVDAGVTGRAQVRLSAYGVLSFGVGGEASVSFAGGPDRTPRWQVFARAGIFAEVSLGLLGYRLWARVTYRLGKPFLVAEHTNAAPVIQLTWPPDGTVVVKGGLLPPQVQATATDPEDGAVPVTWTDDLDQVTVTGSPQTLPFSALGRHTVTASATDSQGRTSSTSVSVVVNPPQLTLTLTTRAIDGTLMDKPSVTQGGTVLVDATIGGWLMGGPTCSGLTWTAVNAKVSTDGSCRASVLVGDHLGTATITAAVVDSYGTKATATRDIAVRAAPPSGPAPLIQGIDVVAKGQHLSAPATLLGAEPITLTATYLNQDQAKVAVTYTWTYRRPGQAPVPLVTVGREGTSSVRTFTPPTPWGYAATFELVVRNAADGSVVTTRSFAVTWQSLPR